MFLRNIKSTVFVCLFGMLHIAHTQVNEQFSNGISSYWKGNIDHFTVNAQQQLQLNAPQAGSSDIYTSIQIMDSMEFSFYIQLQFAPSLSNRLVINLLGDTNVMTNALYLEIGENGNADAWNLFYLNDSIRQSITKGSSGSLSTDPAQCRFRILYRKSKEWIISTDYTGGFNFTEDIRIPDTFNIPLMNPVFGFRCIYTDTRKDKFFFDDVIIKTLESDTMGPLLQSIDILSNTEIRLQFNESVGHPNNLSVNKYIIQGVGNPDQVSAVPNIPNAILCSLNTALPNGNYLLKTTGIVDLVGNITDADSLTFKIKEQVLPQIHQILISEIFADPSPSILLPEKEFIEIHNVSNDSLQLQKCSLSDGSSTAVFPNFTIAPKAYIILCNISDTLLFKPFGQVLGLSNFPSLNNEGDRILLFNAKNEEIHAVEYSSSWYNNATKKDGGWSLEMIDIMDICGGKRNWSASTSPTGGTPGTINAITAHIADTLGPQIVSAFAIDEYVISLQFDRQLDALTATQINNFQFTPQLSLAIADLIEPERTEIEIILNNPLQSSVLYQLQVTIADCQMRNSVQSFDSIVLAEIAMPNELVFNEILFNPRSGGVDFVELINTSQKILTLQNVYLANIFPDTQIVKFSSLVPLYSNQVIALTPQPETLISQYPRSSNANRILTNNLSSMADDLGILLLFRFENNKIITLDSFAYNENMHSKFLANNEGVSLEKINPAISSSNFYNWQSAASTVDYASPGNPNSQNQSDTTHIENDLIVSSGYISPNNDGHNDFLNIQYLTSSTNLKAKLGVYDVSGVQRRIISDAGILGTHSLFVWDGSDDNGAIVEAGNYILVLEVLDSNADKKIFKKTLAVNR